MESITPSVFKGMTVAIKDNIGWVVCKSDGVQFTHPNALIWGGNVDNQNVYLKNPQSFVILEK